METDNIVLEHLRAIRADMAKMADAMRLMGAEMTSLRHHVAGIATLRDADHDDIATIKVRLDRIERRLELVD